MVISENGKVTQKRKILIFEDTHTLNEFLLKKWIEIGRQSVERRNRFTAALSGGRSPMEFYCKLSALDDFDLWKRTHIFLGDERFVPLDDDRSNFKMIKENLLDFVKIPRENIHPVRTDQKNVGLAAEQFKDELMGFFEFDETKAPRFDMILLGLGMDGHTASLFANDANVDGPKRLTLPVSLPQLKEDRISLTLSVINNARNILMPVIGPKKSGIIELVIKGVKEFPASRVAPADGQLLYLLDKEAAQKLPYRDSYSHEGNAILYEPVN